MIRNLRTQRCGTRNKIAQDEPRQIHRMLQGQRDFLTVGKLILSEVAPLVSAQQGAFYMVDNSDGESGAQAAGKLCSEAGNGAKNRFKWARVLSDKRRWKNGLFL